MSDHPPVDPGLEAHRPPALSCVVFRSYYERMLDNARQLGAADPEAWLEEKAREFGFTGIEVLEDEDWV